jgi:hypothetical protein
VKKSAETTQAKVEEPQVKPFTKEVQLRRKPGKKDAKATVIPIPEPEVVQPVNVVPPEPVVEVVAPVVITLEEPAPLTLESLQKALQLLRQDFDTHTVKLEEILALVSKRRKPSANGNGKVQILDTKTQITYKSKNNVYQTLLRNDELTDLISQGVFGQDPKKNSFGWYALNRAFPGRFVEVPPAQVQNG